MYERPVRKPDNGDLKEIQWRAPFKQNGRDDPLGFFEVWDEEAGQPAALGKNNPTTVKPLVATGRTSTYPSEVSMQQPGFDIMDPKNLGRPVFFDLKAHIDAIVSLIRSDELQLALQMCDALPGWYRDNVPPEIRAIKDRLFQQCYDPFDYASDADEAGFDREFVTKQCLSEYTYPRANILFDAIKAMNEAGESPWIFEISPSHGWLPVGFADRGLDFNFFGKNLNQPALVKLKSWLPDGVWKEAPDPDQMRVMVCFEALEHMWNPHDLERSAKKLGMDFDFIYLSTPKYTLGGGLPDWDTRRLGHVRTWTPREFVKFAGDAWPGYDWTLFDSHSMVLRGARVSA